MGALVTLELPADSPARDLPWIITFGPMADDEEWEAVVCGPYERGHALALASAVVDDEELMAVVEPVVPHTSVDDIRADINAARSAEDHSDEADEVDAAEFDDGELAEKLVPPTPADIRAGIARAAARVNDHLATV